MSFLLYLKTYLCESMKKSASILLLLLFLGTNSGMALSLHWCGGKLASIALSSTEKHPCPCSKKAMKPGCCKDKTTTLKANDQLAKSDHFQHKIILPLIGLDRSVQYYTLNLISSQHIASDFYHPPPYKPKVPIYLLAGVFLI